jgi:hypothetical protein
MKIIQNIINSRTSKIFTNVMRIIGSYGIIVVFAQDIGLKSGCRQVLVSHNIFVQIIVFTAVAFSVTDDFYQSFSGTLIYFLLKYIYSKKRIDDVSEDEVKSECKIK